MSIVRRPSALEDLVDLADHIALDNIEAAGRFIRAAEEAFRGLERMPLMGSAREYRKPGVHRRSNVACERISTVPDFLSSD